MGPDRNRIMVELCHRRQRMGEEMREMDTRNEDRLLHQLDRSNLDNSRFNVIIVGGGVIAISIAPVRGALIGGP